MLRLLGAAQSFWDVVLIVFSYAVLIFVMLPVHELAHAGAAFLLGDHTARWHGRLRLNPLVHLDLWGTLLLVLFGFGYARPVPVNANNFRNPKRDMALTALAGPLSNIVMAFLSLVVFRILTVTVTNQIVLELALIALVYVFAGVNLSLAVFNLLPIPPLDGSRIFAAILPARWTWYMDTYHQYFTIGLMLLLVTGTLSVPLNNVVHWIGWLLCAPLGLPNFF